MSVTLISYLAANDPVELDKFPDTVISKAEKALENKHSLINTYHIDIRAALRQSLSAYNQLPTLRLLIVIYCLLQVLEEFETAADEPIKRLDGETDEDYKIRSIFSRLFH